MPRGYDTTAGVRGAFFFGEWLVEPQLCLLTRQDRTAHLEIKIMEVLVSLARHGPRVVSRRQLIDDVWADSCVSDNTLTHAIAELRRALGDSATQPEYIQTLHGRGYRLLKPVVDLGERPPLSVGGPSKFRVLIDNYNVPLREGENLIGRLPEATLCVRSVQASRRHARIIVVENVRAFLEDLGSKNGTQLNGRMVRGQTALHDRDWISLGDGSVAMQFIEAEMIVSPDPADVITPTETYLDA